MAKHFRVRALVLLLQYLLREVHSPELIIHGTATGVDERNATEGINLAPRAQTAAHKNA
jgi:hypothetical protein